MSRIQKNSRNTRKGSLSDTGRFCVDEKKWYKTLPYTPEGKKILQPLRWWNDSKIRGHPVFKSIGAPSREILKKQGDTIHFNADASNTELFSRIIFSVNQHIIYVAVSNRCEQFGLTEEERGQEKQKESVTKGVLTSVKSQEVKLLVSSPRLVSGNSLRENIQDFESPSETIRFTRFSEG